MKKISSFLLLPCALSLWAACRSTPQLTPRTAPPMTVPQERMRNSRLIVPPTDSTAAEEIYSAHTLIAYYDTAVGLDSLLAAIRQMKAEVRYQYHIIPAVALRLPDSLDIHAAKARLESVKGVIQVSRDRILHLNGEATPQPIER